MFGAFRPVVNPTHDDVAAIRWMAVVAEFAAFVFELDADALPRGWADAAAGFAIGEAGVKGLDLEAEARGQQGEYADDAHFVERGVAHGAEAEGFAAYVAAIGNGREFAGDVARDGGVACAGEPGAALEGGRAGRGNQIQDVFPPGMLAGEGAEGIGDAAPTVETAVEG